MFDGTDSKGVGTPFTPGTAGFLNAVTFKTVASGGVDYSGLSGNQDYLVRIGSMVGTTFTEIASETFSDSLVGLTNGNYVTWTLSSCPTKKLST